MRAQLTHQRALVVGGTGVVGQEVLRGLSKANVSAVFTYLKSHEKAKELEALGHKALPLDLRDLHAVQKAASSLAQEAPPVTLLIHCAAVLQSGAITAVSEGDLLSLFTINVASAYTIIRALAPSMRETGAEVILTGALDRTQSLPAPVAFCATQGALGAMTMSLAKELGPSIRVNMVTFGPLKGGLSTGMDAKLLGDYQSFSALRRLGDPKEAADALLWLAFENRYVSGEVIPVNGGI